MRHTLLTLACALLAAAPAHATPAGDLYAFATHGAVFLEVAYSDGLASTKFGFTQLVGQEGGPTQRLEAGALCTEWHGAFSQVLVEARASDHAEAATLLLAGHVGAGPSERHEPGFVFDAVGGPTAYEGRLTVCDDLVGGGSILFSATVRPLPLGGANPAVVRVTPEA